MFSNRKIQKYQLDKNIFDDSVAVYRKFINSKHTSNTYRVDRDDFLLETKCLVKQLNDQLTLNINCRASNQKMLHSIIKSYRKSPPKTRVLIGFSILKLCKHVFSKSKAEEWSEIVEECFAFLNNSKNQEKITDLILIDRIDFTLVWLYKQSPVFCSSLVIKYPNTLKNIISTERFMFGRVTSGEIDSISNNLLLLNKVKSSCSDTMSSNGLLNSNKVVRSVLRKKTSILKNKFDEDQNIHSGRNISFTNPSMTMMNSLQKKSPIRPSHRKLVPRNSAMVLVNKVQSRWHGKRQLIRHFSKTTSDFSQLPALKDCIEDSCIEVEDQFFPQMQTLHQMGNQLSHSGESSDSQFKDQTPSQRPFLMFFEINRVLKVITISNAQIKTEGPHHWISFNINELFTEGISLKIHLSRFKLSRNDQLTQDQYRIIIANSIQIEKKSTKFVFSNRSTTLKSINSHKTIIILQNNDTKTEHFGLCRKVNAYFFQKFVIPLGQFKQSQPTKKFVYDKTLSQLYETVDFTNFKESQLSQVIEGEQKTNQTTEGLQNNYVQSTQQNLKGKKWEGNIFNEQFPNCILPRRHKIPKKHPCLIKAFKKGNKFELMSVSIDTNAQKQTFLEIKGQRGRGLSSCHRLRQQITEQTNKKMSSQDNFWSKEDYIKYGLIPKAGIHSGVQTRLYSRVDKQKVVRVPKIGYMHVRTRFWEQYDEQLIFEVYIQAKKRYYVFMMEVAQLKEICYFTFSATDKQQLKSKVMQHAQSLYKLVDITWACQTTNSAQLNMYLTNANKKQIILAGVQIFCLNYGSKHGKLSYIQLLYPQNYKPTRKSLLKTVSPCDQERFIHRKLILCSSALLTISKHKYSFSTLLSSQFRKEFDYASIIARVKNFALKLSKTVQRNQQLHITHQFYNGRKESCIYKISLESAKQNSQLVISSLYGEKYFSLPINQIVDSWKFFEKLKHKSKFRYIKRVIKDYQ